MQPPSARFEIVTVKTGVPSVRSLEFGETFHPVVGPMVEAEALHVRQQRLVERAETTRGPFVIWDVGLGAAANAIAVLNAFADRAELEVELHSFDQSTEPLEFALSHAAELGYMVPHSGRVAGLLAAGTAQFSGVRWQFHQGHFPDLAQPGRFPAPHAILYDPYSPTANPGLWTLEQFSAVHACLSPSAPCLLSNYTRSTAVRVTLLLAGFYVGRGAATGEKDETTIAANAPELLSAPLEPAWLKRVRSSTRSAPLRIHGVPGPIGEPDWERLLAHPQFAENAHRPA